MSFQENRFPIILGAVTAVAAGGLIYWGMQNSSAYDEAKQEYDDATSRIDTLMRAEVEPNAENLREKTKAVVEYRASVENLQKAFDSYRKPTLENTEVSVFSDALLAARARVSELFEEHGVAMPSAFFLGMGKYTDKLPQAKNTGLLHYELGAFEDLFGRLAEAKPSELLNAHWPDLPEERGEEYDFQGKSYRAHPIEVTFQGSEESFRKFISLLDDGEEYYYVVRSMRVRNSRSAAPSARDARFEQPQPAVDNSSGGGAFDGFVFPDEEEDSDEGADEAPVLEDSPQVDEGPADTGQVFKQVLGSEEIQVFMRIDVLQFVEPKPLPKS
ncbi:MAG: Amuc_1100 family pilus-like protein [Verrucomicrobiales bacterium]